MFHDPALVLAVNSVLEEGLPIAHRPAPSQLGVQILQDFDVDLAQRLVAEDWKHEMVEV